MTDLVAQPAAAGVSDRVVKALLAQALFFKEGAHTVASLEADIRAILALRPQAVPMTPAERERELDRSPVDVSWEAGDAFMEGIYAAEAHHGITAQVGEAK